MKTQGGASTGAATARFQYDGVDLIAEYNGSNVLQRRYVHGPSFDEPVVWYEGAGTSDRRWLVQDQLGSVIAVTNASGDAIAINSYDEYGRPAAANQGRFQYTGQTWLSDASLYHYKARAYSPVLGRFGGDPINWVDPSGLTWWQVCRRISRSPQPDGGPDEMPIDITIEYRCEWIYEDDDLGAAEIGTLTWEDEIVVTGDPAEQEKEERCSVTTIGVELGGAWGFGGMVGGGLYHDRATGAWGWYGAAGPTVGGGGGASGQVGLYESLDVLRGVSVSGSAAVGLGLNAGGSRSVTGGGGAHGGITIGGGSYVGVPITTTGQLGRFRQTPVACRNR